MDVLLIIIFTFSIGALLHLPTKLATLIGLLMLAVGVGVAYFIEVLAGRYSLKVGMYLLSTMERLQTSSGTVQADHLVLGLVEVLSGATRG